MNTQISRLAVAGLVLITSLIVGTTYWQAWAAPSLAERQDNAIKVVAQFTIKRGLILRGRRRHPVGGEPPPAHLRPGLLLPPLPEGRADGASRRLLDPREVADRARALAERLPDRRESEPQHRPGHDPGRAARKDDPGQRHHHHDPVAGPGGGAGGARGPVRRRGRARAVDRQGARPRLEPELRPQPRGAKLRRGAARPWPLSDRASPEPRHRGALHPRLDVQGRDRGGRARLRPLLAGVLLRRSGLLHRVRPAGQQLRHHEPVRPREPVPGTRELDQLVLLRDGQGARPQRDPRLRPALRLLRGPSRSTCPPTSAFRAASTRTGGSFPSRRRGAPTRAGSRSARSGCS